MTLLHLVMVRSWRCGDESVKQSKEKFSCYTLLAASKCKFNVETIVGESGRLAMTSDSCAS